MSSSSERCPGGCGWPTTSCKCAGVKPTSVEIGEKAADRFLRDLAKVKDAKAKKVVIIPLGMAEEIAGLLDEAALADPRDLRLDILRERFCALVKARGGVTP